MRELHFGTLDLRKGSGHRPIYTKPAFSNGVARAQGWTGIEHFTGTSTGIPIESLIETEMLQRKDYRNWIFIT